MEKPRKIDTSLKERLSVLSLLEKIGRENITYAEMDEIGLQLKKVGKAAVQPILRRLWKEKSGLLFSKYTYLLEFLDDSYWLDQIIQIAIKRRDLGNDARSAIMATLDDCGIDVSLPPFSMLFAGNRIQVAELFAQMKEAGEEGLLVFLENFFLIPAEQRQEFLFELAAINDTEVLEPFRILLWHEDETVVRMVLSALARVRSQQAANLLAMFRREADDRYHLYVDQALRRLSFLGIEPEKNLKLPHYRDFHSAYAGPLDGNGYRHICISRWRSDEKLDSVDFQIHDLSGVNSVWGVTAEAPEVYEERAAERLSNELVEPVAPEYALTLLCDALFKNRSFGVPLPTEFYLRGRIFQPAELLAVPYRPESRNSQITVTPVLLGQSVKLFDEEFFAGWGLESCRVYDIAEEWLDLEKKSDGRDITAKLEKLLEALCREEIQPIIKDIADRLYMNADFMARIGAENWLSDAAIAAARSIEQFNMPCHLHPFLRRFAMESMIIARESLEEGYDLREFADEDQE